MTHRISLVLFLMLALPGALFSQWGVEAGVTRDVQSGMFVAPCLCTFANGAGAGYHAALSYDFFWSSVLAVGLKPGIEFQNITSFEVDPHTLARIANGDTQNVGIDYLTIGPYLRYTIPMMSLFAEISPELQYVISSHYQHIPAVAGLNPDTSLDIRSVRYAAAVSVGYQFHVIAFDVAPMVTVDFPLTELRTVNASNWKVTMYTASLAIFF